MKTFLQLCQDLYREGGISGEISSVANQTGEALRVVNWVQSAYLEILNDQGLVWNFLRKEISVQLTPGKGDYTFDELNLAGGVQWDTRSMRVSVNQDGSDETFLMTMRFPDFRNYWLFSSRREVISRPLNAAVDIETKLRLAPIPDQPYWLWAEVQVMPPALLDNGDVPILPDRYQMAIVWRALRHYGMFEAAPEVVVRADTAYKEIMQQMWMDQSPEVIIGAPLC